MKIPWMSEKTTAIPVLVRYHVGEEETKEVAIFVEDVSEAQDFVHMSLRWAVKNMGRDNGAAELFDAHTNEKLGRMAVLFDNSGVINHEQWTWISGPNPAALH